MKNYSIISAIIFLSMATLPVNAQKITGFIGLQAQNIKRPKSVVPEQIVSKIRQPQLNLPKSNDPLVRIRQNGFYSQNFYPQAYLHQNNKHNLHYQLMDRQLSMTTSQRELFVDRLIETAIVKLFNLD
jgi:hypothetical protein